jgi:hypothetical protein
VANFHGIDRVVSLLKLNRAIPNVLAWKMNISINARAVVE